MMKFRPWIWDFGWIALLSAVASASAQTPPAITTQPLGQSASSGANITLSVTATGDAPLRYQWRFNATNFVGATNASLTVNNISFLNGGAYRVVITNSFG